MESSLKTSQLLVTLILSLPFLSSAATDVRSVTHKWRGEPLHNTSTFQLRWEAKEENARPAPRQPLPAGWVLGSWPRVLRALPKVKQIL